MSKISVMSHLNDENKVEMSIRQLEDSHRRPFTTLDIGPVTFFMNSKQVVALRDMLSVHIEQVVDQDICVCSSAEVDFDE